MTMYLHRTTTALPRFIALSSLTLLTACTASPAAEDEHVTAAPEAACSLPIDPSRSLLVTDDAALERFPLEAVMSQIITSAGVSLQDQTPVKLYQQWFDTNNDGMHAQSDGPHCSASLNGSQGAFCPRQE